MIIEYDLQGTELRHKGLFETTGLWLKCSVDNEDPAKPLYTIFGQFNFTYETTSKESFERVFNAITDILSGKSKTFHGEEGLIKIVN